LEAEPRQMRQPVDVSKGQGHGFFDCNRL